MGFYLKAIFQVTLPIINSKDWGRLPRSLLFYMKYILNHQVEVCGYSQHKLSGWSAFATFNTTDGSGTEACCSCEIILNDATAFADFF